MFVPVTAIARAVPFAPPARFCGGIVTVEPVPHGYAIHAIAFAFMMFRSSMSSCSTHTIGLGVDVFVGVRVGVDVGGGFGDRMHNSSMYSTRFVVDIARVWNWMLDNCDSAADSAIVVPQPPCANWFSMIVTAVHVVVTSRS